MNQSLNNNTDEAIKLPPAIIKYMGSKRELIDFVVKGIRELHEGEIICDLFAGTGIVGAVLGQHAEIWSNDIQEYSEFLARAYLMSIDKDSFENTGVEISKVAYKHVSKLKEIFPEYIFSYHNDITLKEFKEIEKKQQSLINHNFNNIPYSLFTQYYSGTYWSTIQCMWIDGYRYAASLLSDTNIYSIILSSLMHAMAYNSQSTGHYAQYRDANKVESMNDIKIYRQKEIKPYFEKKLNQLLDNCSLHQKNHRFTSLDYLNCLESLPKNSIVYADPPYNFVHYSRFYHALETLVKYDYPKVNYKGRYRNNRHQSPFCQKSKVSSAFHSLFEIVSKKRLKLVLSYSDNGMISLDQILSIAEQATNKYDISIKKQDYVHSTMGRAEDKNRFVKELLVILKPN